MKTSTKKAFPIWGVMAALTWAFYYLACEYALMMVDGELNALQGTAVSLISTGLCYIIAYAVFFIYYKFKKVKMPEFKKLSPHNKKIIRIIAICTGGGTLASFASMLFISASISSALSTLFPIGSLLLMMLIKKTKLSKVQKIGAFLATGGAVMIALAPGLGTSSNYLIGCILGFLPSITLSIEAYLCDEALEGELDSESLTCFKAQLSSIYFLPFLILSIAGLLMSGVVFNIGMPAIIGNLICGAMMMVSYLCYFISFEKEGVVVAVSTNVLYAVFLIAIQLLIGTAVGVNFWVVLGALVVLGANLAIYRE